MSLGVVLSELTDEFIQQLFKIRSPDMSAARTFAHNQDFRPKLVLFVSGSTRGRSHVLPFACSQILIELRFTWSLLLANSL